MTVTGAVAPGRPAAAAVRRGPAATILRRAFRQVRTGSVLVGLTFGLSVYATAAAYAKTYPTPALREAAAKAVGSDTGVRILLGPVEDIATIGGYTVYKNFVFLTTLGAVWAVLAATRVLRGEEDAGRWQLQLAGATRPARATAAALGGLALGVLVVLVLGTGLALLTTTDPALDMTTGSVLLHGATLASVPAVFAGVGALTSQLARTRRTATGLGLSVCGATFVVRMIADAGPTTTWPAWLSPFGWAELVRPHTRDDVRPLLLAYAVAVALAVVSGVLAARRDVGDGIIASRDTTTVRPFGLRSALGLSLRLELPTLVAWVCGAALTGFLLGVFSQVVTSALTGGVADTLTRYGVRGSLLDKFLGIAFLLVATVVALMPAAATSAAVQEETSGRLVHLVAAPVRRRAWLGGRLVVTAVAMLVAALLAAVGTWVGAAAQGLHLGLPMLLGAGLNVLPTALVSLGVGALTLSLAPRAAGPVVYAVVVWSVFADLLAPLSGALEPLQKVSLFHAMALLPGGDVDPVAVVVTVVVGLGLCIAGLALFARRDLRTD